MWNYRQIVEFRIFIVGITLNSKCSTSVLSKNSYTNYTFNLLIIQEITIEGKWKILFPYPEKKIIAIAPYSIGKML